MLKELTLCFTSIFVALDIIGTIPLYAGMTRELSPKDKRRIVDTSMFVAAVVAMVFLFLGQVIFNYLGITIFDFKIAGGLVLLLVSLADLLAGPEAIHRPSGQTGIVPLAVPLITGPGVLTTIILQTDTFGRAITLAGIVLNYALAWALLRKSDTVTRLMGKDGSMVVSKIAALLLAAIAVAMIRSGLYAAVKAYF